MRLSRRVKVAASLSAIAFLASSCTEIETRDILHSDPPTAGHNVTMQYTISATPDGNGETNQITMRGFNEASPMPWLTTGFGKAANSRTQTAQVTGADGTAINALSMNKWGNTVGLTEYLDSQSATFEQRDAFGNRVCGAKVRLNFKPNLAQQILHDKYRRAWDALFYYSVPCTDVAQPVSTTETPVTESTEAPPPAVTKPNTKLDISKAKLLGLVINQQFVPRVTGKPIVYNRGHSVTIVGGRAARYKGGWWQMPSSQLSASNMIIDIVGDLDKHEWLSFGNKDNGSLVYSAGDADVYASLNRIFLNRQSAYLVNFRAKPGDPWKRILVNPVYNTEWNDLSQQWHALTGKSMPNIDDMVDQNTGLPKDINDPNTESSKNLKEIEKAGCQNCPNPELEQIQLIDATENSPTEGEPLKVITFRGWLGANSSLMFVSDGLPGRVDDYKDDAESRRKELGMNSCPIKRDENGNRLDAAHQYPTDPAHINDPNGCMTLLREGALWDVLTNKADAFGFDLVGQFRVQDNSTWASHCSGSGENTTCTLDPIERKLDAAYMFTDAQDKMLESCTALQILGEVGMRTFGLSYASGAYDGSGLDFAMAQSVVYNGYFTNMADPNKPFNVEKLFALDARALQLPGTLGEAIQYLYSNN